MAATWDLIVNVAMRIKSSRSAVWSKYIGVSGMARDGQCYFTYTIKTLGVSVEELITAGVRSGVFYRVEITLANVA